MILNTLMCLLFWGAVSFWICSCAAHEIILTCRFAWVSACLSVYVNCLYRFGFSMLPTVPAVVLSHTVTLLWAVLKEPVKLFSLFYGYLTTNRYTVANWTKLSNLSPQSCLSLFLNKYFIHILCLIPFIMTRLIHN